jgi:hypothetical protein
MIYTVKIDDSTRNGKRMMKELSKDSEGVEFENPAITGKIPEGYMTSEEFEKKTIEHINKICKENGIL